MWKSRFAEEQVAYALRQAEQGTPMAQLYPKRGVSEQRCCAWKRRYWS
jgi:putative transposase